MRTFILALATLTASFSAHARSLDPCTPHIQAQTSYLSCPGAYIKINVLMSDRSNGCSEENGNYYEYNTAIIQLPDGTKFQIDNNDFSYKLGNASTSGGTGYFKSKKYNLNLKGCISPVNGGVSIAN